MTTNVEIDAAQLGMTYGTGRITVLEEINKRV